jgi:hypothetical protein
LGSSENTQELFDGAMDVEISNSPSDLSAATMPPPAPRPTASPRRAPRPNAAGISHNPTAAEGDEVIIPKTQQQEPAAADRAAERAAAVPNEQAPDNPGGAEGTGAGEEPPEPNRGSGDAPGDGGGRRTPAAAAADNALADDGEESGPENQLAQQISSQSHELLDANNIKLDTRSFEVQAPFSFGVSEEDFDRACKLLFFFVMYPLLLDSTLT